MAINIGKGNRPSRKTDIEELIYSLIYLLKGRLPWDKIKGKSHADTSIKMNRKTSIKYGVLSQDIPVEFLFIYKNVLKLEFAEKPEYHLNFVL